MKSTVTEHQFRIVTYGVRVGQLLYVGYAWNNQRGRWAVKSSTCSSMENYSEKWLNEFTRPYWLQSDDILTYGIFRYRVVDINLETHEISLEDGWREAENKLKMLERKTTSAQMAKDENSWLYLEELTSADPIYEF